MGFWVNLDVKDERVTSDFYESGMSGLKGLWYGRRKVGGRPESGRKSRTVTDDVRSGGREPRNRSSVLRQEDGFLVSGVSLCSLYVFNIPFPRSDVE